MREGGRKGYMSGAGRQAGRGEHGVRREGVVDRGSGGEGSSREGGSE